MDRFWELYTYRSLAPLAEAASTPECFEAPASVVAISLMTRSSLSSNSATRRFHRFAVPRRARGKAERSQFRDLWG